MKRTATMVLMGALALGPAPLTGVGEAWAQDDVASQVEELSGKGATAYKAGDYDEAIGYFEQAYELEPVANLLYNIARCHEKNNNPDKALEYYEKFILAPDIEDKARESALKKSAQMRDLIDARDDLERDKERQERERLAKLEREKNGGGGGDVTDPGGATQPDGGPGVGAWAALGAGGLLIAGGAVTGFMAMGQQTAFEEATTLEDKQAARDAGQTMALVADGLYVAGAVAVGVGAFLVLTSGGGEEDAAASSEADDGSARVAPWVGPGSGGVDVFWRF
jgi:tetratricopeptide (TPR) repeat protein